MVLYCGYEAYSFAKNQNTLYKTFSAKYHRPGETVLDLDLDAVQLVSQDSRSLFKSAEEVKLQTLIQTLQSAQKDPRVTGLVVRGFSGMRSLGLADISELRAAINDFSKGWGGKHTMLHAPEGIGATGNGTVPLYFASAFDSIHVQPTSGVIIPGLSLATLFFKRLLENVGLKAKKVARKEFKTAANSFTEEKFTDAHRETTESLLSAVMSSIVKGISEGRGMREEEVWNVIDVGMMSSREAKNFGIIDDPLYRDELPDFMRKSLQQSRARRQERRITAKREWRDAMESLKILWDSDNEWHQLWDKGNFIRHLSSAQFAVPKSIFVEDEKAEDATRIIDAEIRALKAHIAWLETCPWEAVEDEEQAIDTVYYAIPHISSLMATEHKLCTEAVKVLEDLPRVLRSCRNGDEDVLKLDKDNFLSVVRWCRSLWRAKSLLARITGTLGDTEEQVSLLLKQETSTHNALHNRVYEPRLFLVGYADEFATGSGSFDTDSQSHNDIQEAVTETSAKMKKLPIRHVRFSDYVDILNAERRASAERVGRRALRNASDTIDHHEKRALMQLQLPGHRIAPWRMNTFTGNIIAVVNIDGPISDDRADMTRAAIRRADKDPNVRAIVLRIESPGGSATASDLISRAVEVAKKPVVASMGSICASGGYFIAAPCDKVFASAMTITGSIGVIFQTFNSSSLFEKIGITADSCDSGRFAKYFGPMAPITEWTEEFAERVDELIDNFYADFVKAVSRGRKMTVEKVENVARGRVWAGTDALQLGLVDEIGGLNEAVQAAADLALLAPDADMKAVEYPTVAMQVQEAARRRGLIPSNLDEEGDEIVSVKRRRTGLWFRSREEPEKAENPNGTNTVTTFLPDYIGEQFSDSVMSNLFLLIDRLLYSDKTPLCARNALERVLQMVLDSAEQRRYKAIVEELELGLATVGRPAAAAANIKVE